MNSILKIIACLLLMTWSMDSIAMEVQPVSQGMIPHEKIIRLVFMGKTGAGKSTTVNAFFNYAKKTPWNAYPKLFPIKTEFQGCNVADYATRIAENHTGGQLGSVTQEPSEYISKGNGFVLSLIDCPGMADTRGMEQDVANANNILKFIATVGEFNAICIVLPVTINRGTKEAAYFIEQVKSTIPSSAYNRIFILVSFANTDNENIKDFVKSVGLPIDNIFNFENFAISKDGYFDNLNINLDDNANEMDDLFGDETPNDSDEKHKAKVKIVKDTWNNSYKEFSKLINKAQKLGKYTSPDIKKMMILKSSVTEKIAEAHRKVEGIEKCEVDIRNAKHYSELADKAYEHALASKDDLEISRLAALKVKQDADAKSLYENIPCRIQEKTYHHNTTCNKCAVVCHEGCGVAWLGEYATHHLVGCGSMTDGRCHVCPGRCHYTEHRHNKYTWVNSTNQQEITGVSAEKSNANNRYNVLRDEVSSKLEVVNAKEKDKTTKQGELNKYTIMLNNLKLQKDCVQHQIVKLYIQLGQVSMSSINFHIADYYDLDIKTSANDKEKVVKLQRDRAFYMEQIEGYKHATKLLNVIENNLALITRDNKVVKDFTKKFKNFSCPTEEEYYSWAQMIMSVCKSDLIAYAGKDETIADGFMKIDNDKLEDLVVLALQNIMNG